MPETESDDLSELTDDADSSVELDSDGDVKSYQFRIGRNLTRRIDQYLVDRVTHLSRNMVQRLIEDELVKVNGHKTKASYHPRQGDQVVMVAPPEPVSELLPEDIPLDVVYEDEHLMAINKQAGLMVHPARGQWTGTLVNALVFYGQKWSTLNGNWRPGILHRLDRNTTGVMLVAKSDEAHWRVARQFENRTIQKTYMAVIHGIPPLLADIIDKPIGRDKKVREKQAIRKLEHGGKPAVTLYEVKETFEVPAGVTLDTGLHPNDRNKPKPPEKFSLLKLTPKTGRTHQLRIHLASMGYPIVGDTMYGGRVFNHGDFRLERQALHAFEIKFVHPGTLDPLKLSAPMPPDLEKLLEILRNSTSSRSSSTRI